MISAKIMPIFLETCLWSNYATFFESSLMGHAQGETIPDFLPGDLGLPNANDFEQNYAHFFVSRLWPNYVFFV